MRSCQSLTICTLLALFSIAGAQTAPPPDVHVKLSLAEKKNVYRVGEPIKLVLEFTADREGYLVEVTPERKEPLLDTIVISPETGITHWLDEFKDNRPHARDYFGTQKLGTSPERIEILLNDTVRFDSPGSYTVHVVTGRIWKSLGASDRWRITTNSITFEIKAMSEADEAIEVNRLKDLLDTKRNPRMDDELAQQLSYLTGDPSTREKVRRFLNPDQRGGNYGSHIWYGLFIARNRLLTLKLIENGLRDPAVPLGHELLYVATRLKTLITHGVREKPDGPVTGLESEDPRAIEIRDAYVVEVAAGLAKRTGNNQTTTAITILSSLPRNPQSSGAVLRELRGILVQQFHTLDPYMQLSLLLQHWEHLRDPALIPVLKKMLAATDRRSSKIREGAMTRLLELAPDEARPYFIAEIRNANSYVNPKVLGALKDDSIPEVDTSLLDQIRALAASITSNVRGVSMPLRFKTELLVRFATASIYRQLMELYRSAGPQLPVDVRAGLLAYFAKHNEREALPLIEQAVSEVKPGEHPQILDDLTELYYSEAIGELLEKLLDVEDVSLVSTAGYLIGRYSSASYQPVLEERLKRWREQWRDRIAEADAQHQGQIERNLVWALINNKSWKLSPQRVRELRMSCMTQVCKQINPAPQ